MLPVPAPRQNKNDISGAISVTCFGWLRIARAAIATIHSMPPATCIVAAARMTARMIRMASTGGEPGSSPKTKTRTATPTPPQMPSATPLDRVPMTIAPMTTSASIANKNPSIPSSFSVSGGSVVDQVLMIGVGRRRVVVSPATRTRERSAR